ncbi:32588_t:CDS:2 [Gigaspora margarita]|uniref:32588_t:CDS:1 n=1 Tax=Gigaspora margarita TaxID=4874 RepID=A0ABN7UJL6_GIGMA|nr:32588_t:CDS:2 [Gigaspora margarita]
MLGMLHHDLQQGQLEMLKENPKANSQDLLDNSLTIDIEDTNANFYLEEELENLCNMEASLTIESLFNIRMYKQIRVETIERSSIVYFQTPTSTSENWSIDDIFKL